MKTSITTDAEKKLAELERAETQIRLELAKPSPELDRDGRVLLSGDDARFVLETLAETTALSVHLARMILRLAERP